MPGQRRFAAAGRRRTYAGSGHNARVADLPAQVWKKRPVVVLSLLLCIDQQWLFQGPSDLLAGVQRAVRVLKYNLYFALDFPPGGRISRFNIDIINDEFAGSRLFN